MSGRIRWGAPLLACALLMATPIGASAKIFLELEGIAGESQVQGFENQIELNSFQLGVSKKDKLPSFSDFVVTKSVDKASPQLMLRTANGATIPSARVRFTKSTADGETVFLRYCFTGVRINSFSQSSGGGIPTETDSFNYTTIVQSYTQQDAGGGVAGVFTTGWDLVKNLEFGAACNN
jgi:type VI secretion system secreted protein Hcp